MARLLYHGPTFGVMDDCTSMLPSSVEEDLHGALLREFGITPIYLTRRACMPAIYGKEVCLGSPGDYSIEEAVANACGWELRCNGEIVPEASDASASASEEKAPVNSSLRPLPVQERVDD